MRTAVGRGGQHGKRAVYAPLRRASTAPAGTPAGLAGTVRLSRAAVNPPEGLSHPSAWTDGSLSSADANDRVFGRRLIYATHGAHHLGERDPEPAGLLLGSDRHSALTEDAEELFHRRSLVAEQ